MATTAAQIGGPYLFLCPHCPKEFKDKDKARRHIATHDPKQYSCSACGKLFRAFCLPLLPLAAGSTRAQPPGTRCLCTRARCTAGSGASATTAIASGVSTPPPDCDGLTSLKVSYADWAVEAPQDLPEGPTKGCVLFVPALRLELLVQNGDGATREATHFVVGACMPAPWCQGHCANGGDGRCGASSAGCWCRTSTLQPTKRHTSTWATGRRT